MKLDNLKCIEQMQAFLSCSQAIAFAVAITKDERYRQWYQSFATARKTLDGMETMRMIQKGQVRYVGKDIKKQNNFICGLFGLAA